MSEGRSIAASRVRYPLYLANLGLLLAVIWLIWRLLPVMLVNVSHIRLLTAAMNDDVSQLPIVAESLTGFQARALAQLMPEKGETWLTSGLTDASQPLTYWALCRWYWQTGKPVQAVDACQHNPSTAAYWIDLGLEAERAGDYAASVPAYEMAAQVDPTSGEAHYRLGWRYLAEKQYAKAIDHLSQATVLDWPQAAMLLGQAYYENHQYREARQVLLKEVEVRPSRLPYLYLAFVAEAEMEWDEADHWYEQLDLLAPNDDRGVLGRGRIALLQKQFELATHYFQRATEIQPEKASNWVELGNAAAQAGDTATAMQAYQQALILQPDNAQAQAGLETLTQE